MVSIWVTVGIARRSILALCNIWCYNAGMRFLLAFMLAVACFGCQNREQAKANVPPIRDTGESQRIKQLEREVDQMRADRLRSERLRAGQSNPAPPAPQETYHRDESQIDREDRQELEAVIREYNATVDAYHKFAGEMGQKYKGLPPVDASQLLSDDPPQQPTEAETQLAKELEQDLQKIRRMEGRLREMRGWFKTHRFGYLYRYERGNGDDPGFYRIIPR